MINVGDRVLWIAKPSWVGTVVNESVFNNTRYLYVVWDNDAGTSTHPEDRHGIAVKNDSFEEDFD